MQAPARRAPHAGDEALSAGLESATRGRSTRGRSTDVGAKCLERRRIRPRPIPTTRPRSTSGRERLPPRKAPLRAQTRPHRRRRAPPEPRGRGRWRRRVKCGDTRRGPVGRRPFPFGGGPRLQVLSERHSATGRFRIDRKAWAPDRYASLYARSSAATSSFTIVILASITALTLLESLSRMSSMNRLGTICQERPNGSLIQPHAVGFAPALTSYVPPSPARKEWLVSLTL
jgi:hypothetical protein